MFQEPRQDALYQCVGAQDGYRTLFLSSHVLPLSNKAYLDNKKAYLDNKKAYLDNKKAYLDNTVWD